MNIPRSLGIFGLALAILLATLGGMHASEAQADAPELCPPGSFSDTGLAPCTPAPAGSYVSSSGATEATLCPPGTYSDFAGAVACTPAPAGWYVSSGGATEATLCPPGTYSDTVGSVACTPAPAGSYVSVSGATEATLCPPGTYSDTVGSVACTPAPVGSYVSISGAAEATLCPPGTTTTALGSDSANDCILVDSDGDGIPDVDDLCPLSNLSSTVVIDGQDTGAPNVLLPGGCSINDLIAAAAADASTHGEFASAVAALTNELKADGYITGKQNGAIQRAAAQVDLP